MVLYSDNPDDATMHVFSVEDLEGFDAEWERFEIVPYSAVLRTDTNRVAAFAN
jgi:hypothetical protein